MATFYADSAGTQGTGDGSSAANACTLAQFLTDNVVLHTARASGDICYVKNGTTITFDGSAGVYATTAVGGTSSAPVFVIGYATTETDGGVVSIQDSNSGATNNCIEHNLGYWSFRNFKFINCKVSINVGSVGSDGFLLDDVEVDNPASNGIVIGAGTGDTPVLSRVYVHDGSADGIQMGNRACRLVNCVSIGNTGDGFQIGQAAYGVYAVNCLAHANGGEGFNITGEAVMVNCVANRNTSDGFVFTSQWPVVMVNCGATSNGAYGVEGSAGVDVLALNCGLNPTNEANTSGKNSSNVSLTEVGAVAGDPDFTDSNPATATDVDLSLSSTSAWKAAGLDLGGTGFSSTATYFDVGPAQRQEAAGGGGNINLLHGKMG